MRDVVPELYGLERLRFRFLQMLQERQSRLAAHTLAAWDGTSVADVNGNLSAAQFILTKISDGARELDFPDLAENTEHAAHQILAHLNGEDADLAICPGELVFYLDQSVALCRDIVASAR